MSTRSLTTVRSQWKNSEWADLAHIYRHWDGYLEGHGKWLFDFLKDLHVVNGIGGDMPERYANGPGELAAQLVWHLHEDGHTPSLEAKRPMGQEYHYVLDVTYGMSGGTVRVTVYDGPMTAFGMGGEECTNKIFEGTVEEFGKFLQKAEVEDDT